MSEKDERIIEAMARATCSAGGCDPDKMITQDFREALIGEPSWKAYCWQAKSQRAAYLAMIKAEKAEQ